MEITAFDLLRMSIPDLKGVTDNGIIEYYQKFMDTLFDDKNDDLVEIGAYLTATNHQDKLRFLIDELETETKTYFFSVNKDRSMFDEKVYSILEHHKQIALLGYCELIEDNIAEDLNPVKAIEILNNQIRAANKLKREISVSSNADILAVGKYNDLMLDVMNSSIEYLKNKIIVLKADCRKHVSPLTKELNQDTIHEKLTLKQIALIYSLNQDVIHGGNKQEIAEKYGYKSGQALYNKYTEFDSPNKRTLPPKNCTPTKLKNKIELFESVLDIIQLRNRERLIGEINTLKGYLPNY